MEAIEQSVEIPAGGVALEAEIVVPVPSRGMVLLVHGESPDHDHPWIGHVAGALQDAGLATTLLGLLAAAEERIDASRGPVSSAIHPLGERVVAAVDWLVEHEFSPGPDIGLFGAGLGAAAALIAATARASVAAIVACGARTDLAAELLHRVRQPTLLIVGEDDWATVGLDGLALARTGGEAHLEVFSGDVDEAARLARNWFVRHLRP
jgi:dienelactone hydrolase